MLQQAVEVALFSPEIRRRAGRRFLIGLAQFSFADRFGNDLFIAGHQRRVDLPEQLRTELRFKIPTECGTRQCLLPCFELRYGLRKGFPQPLHLTVIERIGRIDRISHMADGIKRICIPLFFLHREVGVPNRRVVLRNANLPCRFFNRRLQRLHIRALIGDLAEPYHLSFLLFSLFFQNIAFSSRRFIFGTFSARRLSVGQSLKDSAVNLSPFNRP